MAREDAFNAAKSVWGLYGGLLKDIAQEMGMEKALSLHSTRCADVGAMLAGMMKERVGDKELDIKTVASALSEVYRMSGFDYEMEQTPASLKAACSQCPLYDGLRSAGVAHETIESLCSHGAAVEFAEERKCYPELAGSLKFRSAPDQACVSEYVLVR